MVDISYLVTHVLSTYEVLTVMNASVTKLRAICSLPVVSCGLIVSSKRLPFTCSISVKASLVAVPIFCTKTIVAVATNQ